MEETTLSEDLAFISNNIKEMVKDIQNENHIDAAFKGGYLYRLCKELEYANLNEGEEIKEFVNDAE